MNTQKIEATLTPDQVFGLLAKCAQDENLRVEFTIRVVPAKQKLNSKEAMELLGCKRTRLFTAVQDGTIKKVQQIVGRYVYDRQELIAIRDNGLL